jgi:hypothetical protein
VYLLGSSIGDIGQNYCNSIDGAPAHPTAADSTAPPVARRMPARLVGTA